MAKVEEKTKFCQSKFYKDWNPDTLAKYNSVADKHLRSFFQQPGKQIHLQRIKQMTPDGRMVGEKEWRRMNLEWERRRRDAKEEEDRRRRTEEEDRKRRMELRQLSKQEDMERRKVEERRRREREQAAGLRDVAFTNSNSRVDPQEIKKIVDIINYEIEYVLRPVSAPARRVNGPKLRTSRRARSSTGRQHGRQVSTSINGYPRVPATRSSSAHPFNTDKYAVQAIEPSRRPQSSNASKQIRNICVPENEFNSQNPRPNTAPQPRHRSPTRPNYKEEEYKQSSITLRYIGNVEHRARMRNKNIGKKGLSPVIPAYLDEVTVHQQPRGSYTLEVFKGYLAVGDEFWFTSRRVEGFPFSLTMFVNKQCHVRLSACCESKRIVGTRLGQGMFTLVGVEGADPCLRCMLEKDPVAQKHLAKLKKYRGEYDEWGNRITRSTHLLLDTPDSEKRKRRRNNKKKMKQEEEEEEEKERSKDIEEYEYSRVEEYRYSPLSPSPSPPSRPNRKSSNGGQGAQGAQRGQEGQEGLARGQRLTYTERMEEEHTYTAVRGDRHYLRREQKPREEPEPENHYESDFENEKQDAEYSYEEETYEDENSENPEESKEYENDSFADEVEGSCRSSLSNTPTDSSQKVSEAD
ncbi:glutamate-rich protein 3 [Eurytemora carolleeae]|uniref:glutamate-rich protein 3 n=1 Tax=Eurytemora carolleeae TaxID=1294199 RepID=UPI000C774CFF|nr:glutamate-rich protein 3 [Eurytemora carolleeae]|eukprot:XP_023342787.1 glutamate-rich protein 3-like [Eurytemora affinis]